MDTESFRKYITDYYRKNYTIELKKESFDEWIETEGLPEKVPQPQSKRFAEVDSVLASWRAENTLDRSSAEDWSTHEWLHFLKNLPSDLSPSQMEAIDKFGNFTASGNAEIITAWGVATIRNGYVKMEPKIEEFLINTGRRKFLSPLYNELIKTEEGKRKARGIYRRARPNYHFVATNTFDKLLGY